MIDLQEKLAEPFHPKRVRWRVGRIAGNNAMLLAYVDARDVMERLDAVMGPDNWQDEYVETLSGRVICKILLRINNDWIQKSDGAGSTDFEGEKGAMSDAFKRAAVKHGIGRYLYAVKDVWVPTSSLNKGKYVPDNFDGSKHLPSYKPTFWREWRAFTDALMEHNDSIHQIKECLAEDDFESAQAEWLAISNDDKLALNRAWTKGGIWTPEETQKIKYWSNEWRKK